MLTNHQQREKELNQFIYLFKHLKEQETITLIKIRSEALDVLKIMEAERKTIERSHVSMREKIEKFNKRKKERENERTKL